MPMVARMRFRYNQIDIEAKQAHVSSLPSQRSKFWGTTDPTTHLESKACVVGFPFFALAAEYLEQQIRSIDDSISNSLCSIECIPPSIISEVRLSCQRESKCVLCYWLRVQAPATTTLPQHFCLKTWSSCNGYKKFPGQIRDPNSKLSVVFTAHKHHTIKQDEDVVNNNEENKEFTTVVDVRPAITKDKFRTTTTTSILFIIAAR